MGPMRVLNNLRYAMSHKKGVSKFRKLAKVVKAKTKGINAATQPLFFDHQKRSRVLGFSISSRCQSVGTAEGQLISECLFGRFEFSKKPLKNLTNFCPRI